jgi:hypothetical protein
MKKWGFFCSILLWAWSTAHAGEIRVTYPNGGERLKVGDRVNITWTATGLNNNVKITLWKGGTNVGLIVADTNWRAGSYPWIVGQTPAGNAPEGSDYQIQVKEIAVSNYDKSDDNFTISSSSSGGSGRRRDLDPVGQVRYDLELMDFSGNLRQEGGLSNLNVRVKNNGNANFEAGVKFAFDHREDASFSNPDYQAVIRLNIPKNDSRYVVVPVMFGSFDNYQGCDYLLQGKIDADNLINETNENNNTYAAMLHFGGKRLKFLHLLNIGGKIISTPPGRGIREIELTPRDVLQYFHQGEIINHRIKVAFTYRIQNCGVILGGEEYRFTVRFLQKGCWKAGWGVAWNNPQNGWVADMQRLILTENYEGRVGPVGQIIEKQQTLSLQLMNNRESTLVISVIATDGTRVIDYLTGEVVIHFKDFVQSQ